MSILQGIKKVFAKLFSETKKIIKAVFTTAMNKFLAEIKDFAIYTIEQLEGNSAMSTDDKYQLAFKAIEEYAKAKAIDYRSMWINFAIEFFLTYIRNRLENKNG